jgi:hypothetical protein
MLLKLTIIIAINHFVSFVNFRNCFDKGLTEKPSNAGPYWEMAVKRKLF